MSAAKQFSPNSSGGGDARSSDGSQKMSRKQQQLADKAVAWEATVSQQNERIAQLEQQLKTALGTMEQMNKAADTKQEETWGNYSWSSWSSWWDTSEEPAYKVAKEDNQWQQEDAWKRRGQLGLDEGT